MPSLFYLREIFTQRRKYEEKNFNSRSCSFCAAGAVRVCRAKRGHEVVYLCDK